MRQIEIGQHDIALAYLTFADGSDADFARLLAVLSQGYLKVDMKKAKHCRDVASRYAEGFLERLNMASTEKNEKLMVIEAEAICEVALSLFASGENDLGNSLIEKCFSNWPETELTDESYDLRNVASDAMLSMESPPTSIPFDWKGTTKFWVTSKDQPKARYGTRGIDRQANTSRQFIPASTPPSNIHPTQAKYYALKESKNWPSLLLEVQRLAKKKPGWQTSYSHVGHWSAMDIGLEKTLEWSSKIDDLLTRMSVELGAIGALLPKNERMFRPEVNSSPSMIAPGIRWPTNGC